MPAKKKPTRTMSADHKAALAEGRDQGRTIRRYLEAIESPTKRGRRRTEESITKRLTDIDTQLPDADALKRLQLHQERLDLQAELDARTTTVDIGEIEDGFVEVAAAYGERKGLSYAAWRAVGVDPAVLRRAGITSKTGQ